MPPIDFEREPKNLNFGMCGIVKWWFLGETNMQIFNSFQEMQASHAAGAQSSMSVFNAAPFTDDEFIRMRDALAEASQAIMQATLVVQGVQNHRKEDRNPALGEMTKMLGAVDRQMAPVIDVLFEANR